MLTGERIKIRNPNAVRPWQHVLEPLSGYLLLCQRMYIDGDAYAQAWNFGPSEGDAKPVEWIVNQMLERWPAKHPGYEIVDSDRKHEATMLKLDCSKAFAELELHPAWTLDKALDATLKWTIGYMHGVDIMELCRGQITEYELEASRDLQVTS
ncbi:hypothetical protein [Paenibacillus sp. UNC496MF]|uniref:hypothetical protein n=1 Tax=Paenibacillus sp. UNC496MF TaxID=1502753 RepID=UPI00116073BE|nr:hypothetical protein [Paenibacillus sp. UNC496MF]